MRKREERMAGLIAALLLVALAMASCGGSGGEPTAVLTTAGQPVPGALNLAPPSKLLRSVSFEDADGFCWGADFTPGLPQNGVSAAGSEAWFSPAWSSTGSASPDDLAFAMYAFSLDGFTGSPELAHSWVLPPADWSCCFIGLGNQSRDCWDWYAGPDGSVLEITDLAPYLDGEGQMVLAVIVMGTDICVLDWLCWGCNVPPSAALSADPLSGTAPLQVFFNATGSTDLDGAVDNYEWDFDGDGVFSEPGDEAWALGGPNAVNTYTEVGDYTATVRVTDDGGAQDTASTLITVEPIPWQIITIDDEHNIGDGISLKVVNGHPAISYTADDCQVYTRASSTDGRSEDDWGIPVTVDGSADMAGFNSLAIVDGNPAITYSRGTAGIWYARSTTVNGEAAGDWNHVLCFDQEAYDSSLAVVDGCPAVGIYGPTVLWYVRADTSTGADEADWSTPKIVKAFS